MIISKSSKEIISDFADINFEHCLPLDVGLDFDNSKVKPGQGEAHA